MTNKLNFDGNGPKLTFAFSTAAIAIVGTIIVAFMFQPVFWFVSAGVGLAFTARAFVWAIASNDQRKRKKRTKTAEVQLIETESRSKWLKAHTATFGTTGMIVFDRLPEVGENMAGIGFRQAYVDKKPHTALPAAASQIEGNAELTSIANVLDYERQVCFFGRRRSGKTSAALNWITRYQGDALIIDPKGRRMNLWPQRFKVVDDIQEMEVVVQQFLDEMEQYRKKAVIKRMRKLLFIDELNYLKTQHGIDLISAVMDIAVFGGEYGFDSSFSAQAKTVKALEIDASSLMDNFVVAKSTKEGESTYRAFIVGNDNKEVEYKPYSAYPKPTLNYDDEKSIDVPIFENEEDRRIYAAILESEPGTSYPKVGEKAGLSGSTPTVRGKIKAIVEKYRLQKYQIGGTFRGNKPSTNGKLIEKTPI